MFCKLVNNEEDNKQERERSQCKRLSNVWKQPVHNDRKIKYCDNLLNLAQQVQEELIPDIGIDKHHDEVMASYDITVRC